MNRIVVLVLVLAVSGVPKAVAAPADDARAVLNERCVSCHGAGAQKGGLRLDTLRPDFRDKDSAAVWAAVLERVSAGEMPPPKQPRPTDAESRTLTGWVAGRLRETRQEAGGRVALRRLNRVEYEYTLRDLLDLPHLDIKDVLPPEASAFGFDNVASAQNTSSIQMARYLEAADLALDAAMDLGPRPEKFKERMTFQTQARFHGKDGKGRGEARHVDEWVVFLRQPNSAQTPWKLNHKRAFAEGPHTIRVRCRGGVFADDKLRPADRRHVASVYTREKRLLKTFDVPAEAGVVEFTVWLHAHDELEFFCASLDDRNTPGAGPFKEYSGPGIAVEYLEVEGPIDAAWPRAGHRRLFGDLPVVEWQPASGLKAPAPLSGQDNPRGNDRGGKRAGDAGGGKAWMVASKEPRADAERLLRGFMDKAYRRPAADAEVQRCLKFALEGIAAGHCFQDAMRVAYKAALCSPDFIFLREAGGALDGYALASRLSYFLWRSMPDDALMRLAASGKLREPAVLHAQVERMLDDPKAERFAADFTGQWLDLRKAYDTAPDKLLYPEYFCDNYLVESSVRETEAYFAEMLRRDLPATAVVASDFVMANERLAAVYGLTGVAGCEVRRVPLPAGSVRGGFLTQSAVMKVTANGLTTSPVLRGAWVIDRLLGQPAAPPPPNAGAIEPDTRGATTVREQLAEHRRNESCASCHARIDPPGFALENFDVMGAWRGRYRVFDKGDAVATKVADRTVRYKQGATVDASGETPDGAFRDIAGLRKLLLAHPERLGRNLATRLTTFATGAGVGPLDRPVVDDILSKTRAGGYGLRSLVHAVVGSELFLNK